MEQQNQNQNNVNNPPRTGNHMSNRSQNERSRPQGQERKPFQDRNQGNERRNGDRTQANDRSRVHNDMRYNQKPKDQRLPEKPKTEGQPARPQQNQGLQNTGANPHPNTSAQNNQRLPKGSASSHADNTVRNIKPKRVETLEDIQADIERVEKDIQLEIKQIRAIKLGL